MHILLRACMTLPSSGYVRVIHHYSLKQSLLSSVSLPPPASDQLTLSQFDSHFPESPERTTRVVLVRWLATAKREDNLVRVLRAFSFPFPFRYSMGTQSGPGLRGLSGSKARLDGICEHFWVRLSTGTFWVFLGYLDLNVMMVGEYSPPVPFRNVCGGPPP